eukprot:364976-Chlamydomonas_euryale.AAC.5
MPVEQPYRWFSHAGGAAMRPGGSSSHVRALPPSHGVEARVLVVQPRVLQRLCRARPRLGVDVQQVMHERQHAGVRVGHAVPQAALLRDQQLVAVAAGGAAAAGATGTAAAGAAAGWRCALVKAARVGVAAAGVAPLAQHPLGHRAEDALHAREQCRDRVLQETRRLIDTVLSIQPRVASGAAGKSPDDVVAELSAELEASLGSALRREDAAPGLFDRTETGQLNSLSVVLGQEMDRFNRLTAAMASSLKELQKAIRGLVVMSAELEAMYHSMLNNQVPALWAKRAYPSLKPLASWVGDYHGRVDFMRRWLTEGLPRCFWLPGFFFPQGFMTGVLQMHARKYALPIDALTFAFSVTPFEGPLDVDAPPEDGILVDGLWVDGARWDRATGRLDESEPGVMFAPMPVIHFVPVADFEPPPGQYQCPLYKTSVRAGVLSTTGQSTNFVLHVSLPIREGIQEDHWVLEGVALLCMLND